jgi:hypothetical protein
VCDVVSLADTLRLCCCCLCWSVGWLRLGMSPLALWTVRCRDTFPTPGVSE